MTQFNPPPPTTFTDAEALAYAQQARIQIFVNGQEFEVMGKKFTRANLAELDTLINRLKQVVAEQTNGPLHSTPIFGNW